VALLPVLHVVVCARSAEHTARVISTPPHHTGSFDGANDRIAATTTRVTCSHEQAHWLRPQVHARSRSSKRWSSEAGSNVSQENDEEAAERGNNSNRQQEAPCECVWTQQRSPWSGRRHTPSRTALTSDASEARASLARVGGGGVGPCKVEQQRHNVLLVAVQLKQVQRRRRQAILVEQHNAVESPRLHGGQRYDFRNVMHRARLVRTLCTLLYTLRGGAL
jgi:hypothetical protein